MSIKRMSDRRKRGMVLVVIGICLVMTRLLGIEKIFLYAGIVFLVLGLSDMFYINKYKGLGKR